MLTDLLLKLAASLIKWLLGFFPTIPIPFNVSDFVAAWAQVKPVAAFADYFAPVHEALIILSVLITIRVGLIIWSAVNWLYKRIPILGH